MPILVIIGFVIRLSVTFIEIVVISAVIIRISVVVPIVIGPIVVITSIVCTVRSLLMAVGLRFLFLFLEDFLWFFFWKFVGFVGI